jgi:hypothetical protein
LTGIFNTLPVPKTEKPGLIIRSSVNKTTLIVNRFIFSTKPFPIKFDEVDRFVNAKFTNSPKRTPDKPLIIATPSIIA